MSMKSMIKAACLVLACTVLAGAQKSKLSRDLVTGTSVAQDVIVQYRHTPGSSHTANVVAHGGRVRGDLSRVKMLHVSLPGNQIAQLAADPEVAHISPDRSLTSSSTVSFDIPSTAVNASYAWGLGFTGKGVGVAVIDSGTQNAADFQDSTGKNRVVYNQSFVVGDSGTLDAFGHGLHVAGLIGGNGRRSKGQYEGTAPDATIVNLRVLDNTGTGKDSYVINAIQAAISLKAKYNIRVINLSLGRPVFESYTVDPLCQAVEQAW